MEYFPNQMATELEDNHISWRNWKWIIKPKDEQVGRFLVNLPFLRQERESDWNDNHNWYRSLPPSIYKTKSQ